MRFDVFYVLANQGRGRAWSDLLDEVRRRVVLADELGFDGMWLGEHHFDAEGTDQLPNPVLLCADLAARTQQIRLGMAAVSLPLWHPIRLAEDLAMLDHFSGGRVDVAFSRGILAGEIVNLNPDADRANEAQSRAIFDEHLAMVRAAWTQDPFSWQSERYQIPRPKMKWPAKAYESYHDSAGYLAGLAVLPQPVQSPTPPLYAVSQGLEGFRSAARQGLGIITSHSTPRRAQKLGAAYAEVAAQHGGPPSYMPGPCVLVRDTCVAATDAEAREMMEEQVAVRFELIKRVRGLGEWLEEDEDPSDPAFESMKPFDLMMDRDYLLVGSPDTVAERMIRMHRDYGIEHWSLALGRVSDEQLETTLRLLADEVLPAVRKAATELKDAS
ncbi:LLM class flavin-dependent oxidoreductase [Amycolatopsis sp. FU40]|uniref:LLM class flavin-dependent oxidoreductase n=1 Tax=Amycolatopsis sp. FU40 TaxID=2914159 RepID=UPI001F326DBA|nr:LLM class flavin-dependent oxidoreductase [Amycolatopsis sp. FU40]UKD57710.1 LLM class flavin-dependent oxidoreductase [Amycolatopsis sp. FU40]